MNCASPDDYERLNFCPKQSNASAICKKCEAWQEADHFWHRWFMGGILTDFWHTRREGVRTKYTCPKCGLNAWAKLEVVLLCGTCEVALEADDA